MQSKLLIDTSVFSYARKPMSPGADTILPFLESNPFILCQPILQEMLNGCELRRHKDPIAADELLRWTDSMIELAGHVTPLDVASQRELADLKARPSLRHFRYDEPLARGRQDKEVLAKVALAIANNLLIVTLSPLKFAFIQTSLRSTGKTFAFVEPRWRGKISFVGFEEFEQAANR